VCPGRCGTIFKVNVTVTYTGLTYGALPKLVEVNKKLLDADEVFGNESLKTLFNIILYLEGGLRTLEGARMTVGCSGHVLDLVAKCLVGGLS
jgi:hypothetical protein